MLKVKLRIGGRRFFIPVPYVLLNLVSMMMTSKWMIRLLNKSIASSETAFIFPEIDRKELKILLKEFSKHRGVVLVDAKIKEGTEVKVTL